MSEGAPSSAAQAGRYAALALVLLVGVFAVHVAYTSGAIIDDAYIAFRYARNLTLGHGLVYNPGERVEGYTDFSWVMLAAGALRLGLDPAWAMPLLGVASGVGAVVTSGLGARALARDSGTLHAFSGVPAAAVVSLSPSLAFYAGTGLETALFTLLCALAGLALARGRAAAFALATGIAFLTRPEAGLIGLAGIAALAQGPRRRRDLPRAVAVLAAIVVPYLLFKRVYFGTLVPNTLAAKPPLLGGGTTYVLAALPGVAGLVLATLSGARTRPRAILLGLWALYGIAVVFEGGDWMNAQRMLVPSLPWLAMAADGPVLSLAGVPRGPRDAWRPLAFAAALSYVPLAWPDVKDLREWASEIATYDPVRARVAHALSESGARSVGTVDIGLVGYLEPDLRILDLGGLTDATIAHAPGSHLHKDIPAWYLASRSPDAFLLMSRVPPVRGTRSGEVYAAASYGTEQRVMATPWFGQHYTYRATIAVREDYYLEWFERRP